MEINLAKSCIGSGKSYCRNSDKIHSIFRINWKGYYVGTQVDAYKKDENIAQCTLNVQSQ